MKIKLACPYCESNEVGIEATAAWNVEQQQWELATMYDTMFCSDCGETFKTCNEVEVNA